LHLRRKINSAGYGVIEAEQGSSGNAAGDYSSATASYEVVTFELTKDAADAFMRPLIADIAVDEWNEEYLEYLGMKESGAYSYKYDKILSAFTGDKSKIELQVAELEQYDDSTYINEFEATFYYRLDNEAGAELAKLFIDNLYECGAKYTEEGTVIDKNDSYDYQIVQEDGKYTEIYLNAYVNASEYCYVSYNASWNEYLSGGTWIVNVEFSKP